VDPKEHPILFSEPSLHNKEHRIKLTEFMFEKYSIPAMFICKSAVLSAFSCGRSTCLVFDSGHSTTYSVPVNDGYALQKPLIKSDIAGGVITNELMRIIENVKGCPVIPHYKFVKNKIEEQFVSEYLSNVRDDPTYEQFWKREIVRDAKETCLAVSEDQMSHGNNPYNAGNPQGLYELPDGRMVDLNEERLTLTERLFMPNKDIGFIGYPQMVLDAIQ
jgi:actin-related protein